MKYVCITCFILVILASLNLMGIAMSGINVVERIFGQGSLLTRIIYGLMGVAGNYMIGFLLIYKPFKGLSK